MHLCSARIRHDFFPVAKFTNFPSKVLDLAAQNSIFHCTFEYKSFRYSYSAGFAIKRLGYFPIVTRFGFWGRRPRSAPLWILSLFTWFRCHSVKLIECTALSNGLPHLVTSRDRPSTQLPYSVKGLAQVSHAQTTVACASQSLPISGHPREDTWLPETRINHQPEERASLTLSAPQVRRNKRNKRNADGLQKIQKLILTSKWYWSVSSLFTIDRSLLHDQVNTPRPLFLAKKLRLKNVKWKLLRKSLKNVGQAPEADLTPKVTREEVLQNLVNAARETTKSGWRDLMTQSTRQGRTWHLKQQKTI